MRSSGRGLRRLRGFFRTTGFGEIERFTKEIAPLILTGNAIGNRFRRRTPKVEEIMAYFPALIPKTLIETTVEIVEA